MRSTHPLVPAALLAAFAVSGAWSCGRHDRTEQARTTDTAAQTGMAPRANDTTNAGTSNPAAANPSAAAPDTTSNRTSSAGATPPAPPESTANGAAGQPSANAARPSAPRSADTAAP